MTIREISNEINKAGYEVEASISIESVRVDLKPIGGWGAGVSQALWPDFSFTGMTSSTTKPLRRYQALLAYGAMMLFEFQEREGLV
jgi:hypothetical protein